MKHTFVIAELSANHNGKKETAIETIKAIKRSGADAVKLQTYTPDTITLDCKTELFKINQNSVWDGKYLYELYKEAYTPWEWHCELFEAAKKEGLVCFSSPFDKSAVDLLESLNCPIYKIASLEITDIPLIEYIASKHKPMIISTGIASVDDIELALAVCKKQNNTDITLLKCVSEYPTLPEHANLLTIPDMKTRFNVKVGLSDHTLGIEAPAVAVALGAEMIEKHFILNHDIGGPDAHFSLDESEFTQMVDAVRTTEKLLGEITYELTEFQKRPRKFARSLFAVKDIQTGEIFTEENIRSIRPGAGCSPKYLPELLGTKSDRDYKRGEPLIYESEGNN